MIEFTHLKATADDDQHAPRFGESSTTTERFLMDKIKELEDVNNLANGFHAAYLKRIAELEAQVPRVVVVSMTQNISGVYCCECGAEPDYAYSPQGDWKGSPYCCWCGAKLDWTEVEK